jgi:DNA-binding GntR family transcriptional regulator
MLLNRITVLRLTSMSQRGRIKHTLAEMSAIVKAIRAGNEEAAERACTVHVQNASAAALDMLEQNRSETASGSEERRDRFIPAGRTKGGRV